MRSSGRPQFKMWEIGEPVEIGLTDKDTFSTSWHPAIILKLSPFTVQYESDGRTEELPLGAFRRRPDKKETEEPKKVELPAEVLKTVYHKALIEIIKEGSTDRPNSTVKRILNIAKEAVGEIQI